MSHPQTRPNQPTGPQAHAASHTGTHQHTGHRITQAHTHTDTYPRHAQSEPQSQTQVRRDTADTQVTQTQEPTGTTTRAHTFTAHTHLVRSQSPALLPLKSTLTGTDTHTRIHTRLTYSAPMASCLPPPYLPVLAQGTLPQKGSTEKK